MASRSFSADLTSLGGAKIKNLPAATADGEAVRFQQNKRIVTVTFDGQGSVPAAGTLAYIICPLPGTIIGWRIVGNVSGAAVVDVWKTAYGASLPTVANTIAAAAKPTLTSAQVNKDDVLSGWTVAVAAEDIFGFRLDSASTLTRLVVELVINPS